MKYHIVFKFLAVALCALFLLSAAGSGIGIIALTTSDLYEKSVDEVYDEAIGTLADAFAGQIASKYASQALGNCPEEMLEYYGKIFTSGYYGYTLKDANGNVLDYKKVPEHTEARYFNIPVTGRSYQKLVSVTPQSELNATAATIAPVYTGESFIYDAVPPDGTEVGRITVTFSNGDAESIGASDPLGLISHQEDGTVSFIGLDAHYFLSQSGTVSQVTFYDMNNEVLFDASADTGSAIGLFFENGANNVCFQFLETSPTVLPATTAPVTLPDTTSVTETPTEVPTAPPTEPVAQEIPTVIADNMQQLGYHVAVVTIYDELNYTGGIERATNFGFLFLNEDDTVTFRSYDPMDIPTHPEIITHIEFYDAQGRLLYKVQSPKGVGSFRQNEFGMLEFVTTITPADVEVAKAAATEVPTEVPTEAPTEIPTEEPAEMPAESPTEIPTEAVADKTNIIAEVTEPPTEAPAPDFFTTQYWDAELQEHVQAKFTYEDLPEGYTVELWLLPGAYELDPLYDLLVLVWQHRNDLFYVLGVSALLFAVFAVYLCCAAGRKPGREEIRSGGLNCLPLDMYLAGGGFLVYGLVHFSAEGALYLLRNSPHVIAQYILIAGYLIALIIVGFSFACAAQFKTPGWYCLKNTLFARIIRMILGMGAWLEQFLSRKFFPFLGRAIRFFWRGGKKLCIGFYRYTEKFLGWLYRFIGRSIRFMWKYGTLFAVTGFRWLDKTLTWLGKGIGKIAQRTYAWLHAFLSLLPVTWQWLLTGLGLLFLLAMALLTRSEGVFVLSVLAGIALVVYGSHCFGVLWESTRHMSKGELETKVDDKLMVGAFKDFAADLNALADVAVVAAQKQLKSERMKTELITNVSHDIKTPLTSIISYVDLLQKPHSDEEQEIYLEVLSRQSLQMKKLLEDLIEMSKASTGNMPVYLTQLNAAEALNQAIGEFSDKLDAAQLTPVIRQPEEDVLIHADGRLLWRVLSNLLSNAVKYALPGTRVYIELTKEGEKAQISVKNISREPLNIHTDELMERFVRGDASRNTEGSGLGLNIAQSLMEIQKGKLEITVDGDLFKVTLTFPAASE